MKDWSDILGQPTDGTGTGIIHLLEEAISEGLLSTSSFPDVAGRNVFGRTVFRATGSDLSFLAGIAATGLRSGAFLKDGELTANYNQLSELVRRHLPAVIHYTPQRTDVAGSLSAGDYSGLHAVAGAGCFQFVASDLQEAIDHAVIAHKVAERTLIPGICTLDSQASEPAKLPSAKVLRRFLGDPDQHLPPSTPAQEILFGNERRRVPQWFSLDTPMLSGVRKDARSRDLEGTAQGRYFHRPLPEIIEAVMEEYSRHTGRSRAPLSSYRTERANYLVLTIGKAFQQVKAVIDRLRTEEGLKIGGLHLSTLRPFPDALLAAQLNGVKGVTVLEGFSGRENGDAPLYREVKAVAQALGKRAPKIFSARYGSVLSPEALAGAARNMSRKKEQRERVILDIHYTRSRSSLPQHEVLLQTIRRAYPDIKAETIAGGPAPETGEGAPLHRLPFAVRRYQDAGPPFTRLSRFYHHTACFYQRGVTIELVADPFQALPVLPAATASFAPTYTRQSERPVFHPQNCTGCGACFTYCPHSALPPLAIDPEALIRGAMDIAAQQGTPVTGLTPLVRNLAKVSGQVIREQTEEIECVEDFLPAAFDRLAQKMKLTGEKLEKTREEMDTLLSIIHRFPTAVTDPFFIQPESQHTGSGALFSLAVDPHACTGCGLCVALCEDEALSMQSGEAPLMEQLEETLQRWEQLPDTSSEILRRLIHQDDYDPFAATLLSRNFYHSLTGGASSEAGAPAKTMVHLLTAVAESVLQPRLAAQATQLQERIDELSANIHGHLSDALPREDFQLALEEIRESRLPLDAVIRNLQPSGHPKMIDAPSLQRKIELLNDLKALLRAVKEGPTGGGRSRYGLSLASAQAMPWATDYPYNPFTAPVIWHWDGAAPERLRGMMMGLQRHLIDNIRLLRRAGLEIKDQYRSEIHDREISSLCWSQLKEQEQQLLAPIMLIGDTRLLSTAHSGGLLEVLSLELPVKVIVLDTDASPSELARSNSALFATMTTRRTQIIKGSLAASRPLFEGLRDGLHSLRPALFHLMIPDPQKQVEQESPWTTLPSLALRTRAFPFFRYDPDIAGGYLASDINLEANPSPDDDWVTSPLRYKDGEKEKEISYTWTYADWLFRRRKWRKNFRPAEAEEKTIPVADYLLLPEEEQLEKVPVIYTTDEAKRLTAYVATAPVVTATRDAQWQWNSLREVAGARAAFPQKIRQQIEEELTQKHEQATADLKDSYEEKLRTQHQEMMEQVRQRLSDKLLALSRKAKQD